MNCYAKRILALLLMLLLGLGLFSPAAAAADPRAPVITKQPQAEKTVVQLGRELKLEAEAKLPKGTAGTLRYEWYAFVDWTPGADIEPIATGAKATIPVTQEIIGDSAVLGSTGPFYVVVTNTYMDSTGQTRHAYTKSDSVTITLFPGFGVIPAVIKDMLTWGIPWSVILFPFVLLPGLFRTILAETRYSIASLF